MIVRAGLLDESMKWIFLCFITYFSFRVDAQGCIVGKIIDSNTGLPVVEASVFFPDEQSLVKSDSSGRFMICGLSEVRTIVEVRAFGYRSELIETIMSDSLVFIDFALIPEFYEQEEVVVYGGQYRKREKTSNQIESFSVEEMRSDGAISVSDGLAKQPGISQLTTGVGISKPVINGLYGNRIQTVMLGLRFDNQQWQDEHGLGVSDVGIDRVEVIKGPASLLYGPEAMGGVVNIIEEKPAATNKIESDLSLRLFSNTYGIATDAGIKGAKGNINWRVRLGAESHADYTDGNNERVVNTRFGGYYLKSSFGIRRKNWVSKNYYMFSLSNYGFIMDDAASFYDKDGRQSRSFHMPHHSVYQNVASSENTIFLRSSLLKIQLGAQFNNRQEQEGGNKISLDMLLNTYSIKVLWEKEFSDHLTLSAGTQEMFQTNENLGSRMIVPDAQKAEISGFAYFKSSWGNSVIDGGLRYGLKNITTFETGSINVEVDNPGADVLPFDRWYNAINGALGFSLFDNRHWNLKANMSSGFRPGNLAELSSNGLHEGTVRYEIGNTELQTEQNVSLNVAASFKTNPFTLSASGYINHFRNYIYLAPTSEEYIGFQIFRYVQKNADLKGWEGRVAYHPRRFNWIRIESAYSAVLGITNDGEYLPFIPANKSNSELRLTAKRIGKLKNSFFRVEGVYISRQLRPGQFETTTGEYWLLNASVGTAIGEMTVSIAVNNLLKETYYDHLSRYKYFGIYNMGRNVVLNMNYKF